MGSSYCLLMKFTLWLEQVFKKFIVMKHDAFTLLICFRLRSSYISLLLITEVTFWIYDYVLIVGLGNIVIMIVICTHMNML